MELGGDRAGSRGETPEAKLLSQDFAKIHDTLTSQVGKLGLYDALGSVGGVRVLGPGFRLWLMPGLAFPARNRHLDEPRCCSAWNFPVGPVSVSRGGGHGGW